jgi:hypothetical protein
MQKLGFEKKAKTKKASRTMIIELATTMAQSKIFRMKLWWHPSIHLVLSA